jgi:hypothetical protein
MQKTPDPPWIPTPFTIEYVDSGRQIRGVGTFAFLHKYLDWPQPAK